MGVWYMVASMVASALFSAMASPDPAEPEPPVYDETTQPKSEEGSPVIVVFGEVIIDDYTVIGMGNFRTSEIYREVD